MKAYHDPSDKKYRDPFGAVPCGGRVLLRLYTEKECAVTLRAWDGEERLLSPVSRTAECGRFCYAFELSARQPGLIWYDFRVESEGARYYLGAADEELRLGCALGHDLPKDWRITVYQKDFTTPEWFRGCTAYQIFPDRFRRGKYDGLEKAVEYHRNLGRRIQPKSWEEPPDYLPREGRKYYAPDDFYFGNFRGIRDGLPYLKSLGVDCVYLNPIFESPYNHRYSISDYMRPDPLLGTEKDFADMCAVLKKEGVRVILDGVFSHTGDDSRYFDRRGNYGGGAYHDTDSPYRKWYRFDKKYRCGYKSWWGFDTLPEVNELEPSYMAFIAEAVKKWMSLGASGWRLDVADELPDGFLKFLRSTLKTVDPEAVLIGEVWEDAATKKGDCDGEGHISRRGYTDGDMLDGVMDYPFADAVCDFLTGAEDSQRLKDRLFAQLAGYPAEFMAAQLGILGSHDTVRILSRLSGAPHRDALKREQQAVWRPTAEGLREGRKRLMQAALLQFAMPFAPCIYYGDEVGMQGLADPFCRAAFPWGHEDRELTEYYRGLAAARREHPALRYGETAFAAPDAETFVILRRLDNEAALAIVSKSPRSFALRREDFAGAAEGIDLEIKTESPALLKFFEV